MCMAHYNLAPWGKKGEKRLQTCVCPIMQSISGRIHKELLATGYTFQF